MSRVDTETAVAALDAPDGPDTGTRHWRTRLHRAWNIGDNANGGYALTPLLRAMAVTAGHADPVSVTAHFLRPGRGDVDAGLITRTVRAGRRVSTVSGDLTQDGSLRITALAAFADLRSSATAVDADLTLEPPDLPPPERCRPRSGLEQGIELPILSRLDVRIHPDRARAGGSGTAEISGWIRFADATPPSTLTLPLFADAFPPSLYAWLGRVGWVPTIELTVHVRRRPAPGWIRGRFVCDDLSDGWMIESGALWDAEGRLVARSRQLGLVLDPGT